MIKQYTSKKREVQYHFYNKVQQKSSITALAGNNLDLHIKDILPLLSRQSKAYIYDLNKQVINKFKYLSELHNKVQLINDNILNAKITRFMDIDLMATLNTTQGIIYYLFTEQYLKYKQSSQISNKNKINTFMFTYCLRGKNRDLNSFIYSMLKEKNINIVELESMTYRDGAPMCTVQLQWEVK